MRPVWAGRRHSPATKHIGHFLKTNALACERTSLIFLPREHLVLDDLFAQGEPCRSSFLHRKVGIRCQLPGYLGKVSPSPAPLLEVSRT